MVGESEVVVRREADQPATVDLHHRALRAAEDPQVTVEVLAAERGDLVGEEVEGAGGHQV
jgi:hypothetical protein